MIFLFYEESKDHTGLDNTACLVVKTKIQYITCFCSSGGGGDCDLKKAIAKEINDKRFHVRCSFGHTFKVKFMLSI